MARIRIRRANTSVPIVPQGLYRVGQVVLARSIAPPIYVLGTMLAKVVAIRPVPGDDCVAFYYHLYYPILGVFSEGYEAEATLASVGRKTLTTAERNLQALLEELNDLAYDLEMGDGGETGDEDEDEEDAITNHGDEFEDADDV